MKKYIVGVSDFSLKIKIGVKMSKSVKKAIQPTGSALLKNRVSTF